MIKHRAVWGLFLIANFWQYGCDSSENNGNNPPITLAPSDNTSDNKAPQEAPAGLQPGSDTGDRVPGAEPALDLDLVTGLEVERDTFLKELGIAIASKLEELNVLSDELGQYTQDFCGDLNLDAHLKAKETWKHLMLKWQELELMQVGPLAEDAKTLKVNIYAWPLGSNLCKIDEEALSAFTQPSYSLPSNYNRKGLQAIEFLLFDDSLEPRCSRTNPITTQWANLTKANRWNARCAYLELVVKELKENLLTLNARWGTRENNVLSRAVGSEETEQKFLQEFFDNLFYLDIEVKNRKLGEPLGLDPRYCKASPEPCLNQQEFRFGKLSRLAIDVNLKAFADLMYGPILDNETARQGGFSALVRQSGASELAEKTEALVSAMIAFALASDSSIEVLAEQQASQSCELNRSTWVCKLKEIIRTISGDLKKEYSQILKLKIPESTQGDND